MDFYDDARADAREEARQEDRAARLRVCPLCTGGHNCPECSGWDDDGDEDEPDEAASESV